MENFSSCDRFEEAFPKTQLPENARSDGGAEVTSPAKRIHGHRDGDRSNDFRSRRLVSDSVGATTSTPNSKISVVNEGINYSDIHHRPDEISSQDPIERCIKERNAAANSSLLGQICGSYEDHFDAT